MALSYTIREVAVDSITVDYANGSWAVVPIENNLSRQAIENRIREFAGLRVAFPAAGDVPFSVGDTGEVLSDEELREQQLQELAAQKYSYAEIRQRYYPTLGDQLDAAFWARNGREADQVAIDALIESIKQAIPKDAAPMTLEEAHALTNMTLPGPLEGMTTQQLIDALES